MFKNQYLFDIRLAEANTVLRKYPDRVPVICERQKNAPNDCPQIDKRKYLVPNDLSLGQFIYIIRKRLKLPPEKAIFLFINGNIIEASQLLCTVYNNYKDPDNFLYITYTFENTFGTKIN
jgi:GABA(A) receptor-associated protein